MVVKIKKKKKSVRMRGTNSHGGGSRKKRKGKGHHGGKGMAGTGKKADHKITLITKKYGNKYFGKQGITSRGTKKRKIKEINLKDIEKNLTSFTKKYGKDNELVLKNHKILGDGELKSKLIIKAEAFTKSAINKIEKAGGKAIELHPKTKPKAKEKQPKVEDKKEIVNKPSE